MEYEYKIVEFRPKVNDGRAYTQFEELLNEYGKQGFRLKFKPSHEDLYYIQDSFIVLEKIHREDL